MKTKKSRCFKKNCDMLSPTWKHETEQFIISHLYKPSHYIKYTKGFDISPKEISDLFI